MNGSSLATLAVLAATAAVSPFSLIVFSLVLATDRGARNGVSFILGWIVTVTLIGFVMISIGGEVQPSTHPGARKWYLAIQLTLGTVLILVWLRRRFRPRPKAPVEHKAPAKQPAWQRKIATMGYVGAFVLGGATQTWPVMIAAGAELAKLDLSLPVAMSWMFAFALVTTIGIDILEGLAVRHPGSAADRLDRIRDYIDNHRDSVVNWLILVGGLVLVYRGLIGIL